jgi:ABC-type multidrug transport system ATPase subunit|tara:strand:- start:6 stop:590 length:585 start_codon:yes stop_codon:yes gene_type:complete
MYAAMIRLPIDKAAAGCRTSSICQQKKRRYYKDYVDEVLDMLQIGHVQHSIVGSVEKRGISGGQRKRVNIGLELVADPDVLFLDEPTSGLDSTSAEIILAALKDLSRLGRTIIMVIHQPRYSIFASMDNVIFLGPGGKTVYSGSPLDATDYFEMLGFFAPPAVNRADFFMDVIGGKICRALLSSFCLGVRLACG